MWRGKGHCRKAGSSLVDWPAHCADTRAQRNKIHRVIPGCLLSSHASGKIRANHLTQNLAKEDHADPCMACSSLEMKPVQQRRSRSSPTSEHQRLRKLPRRGSGGVKFRYGLAPGSEKVSDNDIVFRQYYTNRQEKFWSNLAHKQHHRGATTRRHAGIVAFSHTILKDGFSFCLMFLSQHLTLKIKPTSSRETKNLICRFLLLMFLFVQSRKYLPCLFQCDAAWCHTQPNNPVYFHKIGESHQWTKSLCLPQHQSPSEHKHKKSRTNIRNPVQKTCFHSPKRQ